MRELKGALVNDFFLMRTQGFGIYLMGTVGMLVIAVMLDNQDIMVWAQMFVLTMAPLAALESSIASFANRWNVFEKSFSISPMLMVLSRYIIFVSLSLLCAVLWTVSPFEVDYAHNFFSRVNLLVYWMQLLCIIYYPVMYLLNPNKSSSGVVIAFVAAVGAAILTNFVVVPIVGENRLLVIALIAVMYVVSVMVSMFFDKVNRGRA